MPRTAKYANKSDFVRQFLAQNPDATDEQIISAGRRAKQNITKFSIGYVRYARPSLDKPFNYTKPSLDTRIQQAIAADTPIDSIPLPAVDVAASRQNPFSGLTKTRMWKDIDKDVETVRKFCEKHGGIEAVKTIIDNLAQWDQLRKLLKS